MRLTTFLSWSSRALISVWCPETAGVQRRGRRAAAPIRCEANYSNVKKAESRRARRATAVGALF